MVGGSFRIDHLTSEKGRTLNGKICRVVGFTPDAKKNPDGRLQCVVMDGAGNSGSKPILIKGCNLVRVETVEGGDGASRVVFIFTGDNGEDVPRDVTHITFAADVVIVEEGTFYGLETLQEVTFNEGLKDIENASFAHCCSLKHLVFPHSIERIGKKAFFSCTRLRTIHFRDNDYFDYGPPYSELNYIEDCAFRKCISLLRVDLPDSLDMVGACGDSAFHGCEILNNVHSNAAATMYLEGMIGFKGRFPRLGRKGIDYVMCRDRFDGREIHSWCFYYPYNGLTKEESVKELHETIEEFVSYDDDPHPLNIDRLGMTPLHILASSSKHDVELYRILLERSPGDLMTEDKWGYLPVDYALLNEAPIEVICFFFTEHKARGSPMPISLELGQIIPMLLHFVKPTLDFITQIIQVHEAIFCDKKANWANVRDFVAMKLSGVDGDILEKLVELSLQDKLAALAPTKRSEIEGCIQAITHEIMPEQLKLLRSILTLWELQESTTLLELALWKTKLDDGGDSEDQDREACRTKSGADVVIKGVLQYFQYNSNAREDYDDLLAAQEEGEEAGSNDSDDSAIEMETFQDEVLF